MFISSLQIVYNIENTSVDIGTKDNVFIMITNRKNKSNKYDYRNYDVQVRG